jgi:hypothetical protein
MNPGVRYAFVTGLTEDFLGYIVPRYNFLLDPVKPYLNEPAGDHCEETHSIGPGSQRFLYAPMESIVRWRPSPSQKFTVDRKITLQTGAPPPP